MNSFVSRAYKAMEAQEVQRGLLLWALQINLYSLMVYIVTACGCSEKSNLSSHCMNLALCV